ncbi:MAG: TRAP transporter TatT component family protein [Acidobacteriota bacterium]|jgi:tetratricopeptide (TPR) repeat protein|nr:TRAP transporter TatT component family protein [Acidobacteriota bacterium]
MKHKKTYNLVRKLIDERELDEDNMETAHEELIELIEEDETCGWAYGLLAEIYYWKGETADAEDKLFYYDKGVEYGEQGVEVDEDSLEANFWLSVNYGSYGQEKGIMKSLSLITPIKDLSEKCIELDESYFYGGAWRILGRLYHKAPGFPLSLGNNKKALECFEKALEFGPKFYLNHLFLAELYISTRKKDKAREHLEWILEAPLNKNYEREDESYKRDAERLLEDL